MRRARIGNRGTHQPARKSCFACKGNLKDVGPLSRRGLCGSCAVAHLVAQMMGMDYCHYVDESISSGIRLSYTGPVLKSA